MDKIKRFQNYLFLITTMYQVARRMHYYISISSCVFLLTLFSCDGYVNDRCKSNYIGTFVYDTSQPLDSKYKTIIIERRWDSVRLISDSTGKFYFRTKDSILKKCEGKWYMAPPDTEGNCSVYIQQNNLEGPYSGSFSIKGDISDSISFIIPFKKISD